MLEEIKYEGYEHQVARKEVRGNALQPSAQHPPLLKLGSPEKPLPLLHVAPIGTQQELNQKEPEDQLVQNSTVRAQETKLSLKLQPTKG